jgi:hypothetical protein
LKQLKKLRVYNILIKTIQIKYFIFKICFFIRKKINNYRNNSKNKGGLKAPFFIFKIKVLFMNIPYENLELIPQLLHKLNNLEYQLKQLTKQKSTIPLTKVSQVANYLNVNKLTIYNMIKDGRLLENIHYKKEILNNKLKYTFIENAIIKYKELQ